jgi:hypothetical protein
MQCHWCKGTAEECGCGYGYCAHCAEGEVTDPPFGPERYLEFFDEILKPSDFEQCVDWSVPHEQRMRAFSDAISKILRSDYRLNDDEVAMFEKYWEDQYRDETIGEVLQRVAMLIKAKS